MSLVRSKAVEPDRGAILDGCSRSQKLFDGEAGA